MVLSLRLVARACVVLYVMAFCPASGGQTLYTAPAMPLGDRIRFLTDPHAEDRSSVELFFFGRGDTNVIALSRGDSKHIDPTLFQGRWAYLSDYHAVGMRYSHRSWRISVDSTAADLYSGNRDAGQLYLDSLSNRIDYHAAIAPEATMNRTEINRLRIGYAFDVRVAGRPGVMLVTGALLDVHRFQVGTLTGTNQGGQFTGDLSILTTLGVLPSETRSPGASLDAALSMSVAPRWRAAISIENLLGHVWQRKLQRLDITVKTNAVEPDANGFLHGIPLGQGRISFVSANADLMRKVDLGTCYSSGRYDWLASVSYDFDWRAATGLSWRTGKNQRVWSMFGVTPFEWLAGYESPSWRLEIGMSATSYDQSKRGSISLTWRIPLRR